MGRVSLKELPYQVGESSHQLRAGVAIQEQSCQIGTVVEVPHHLGQPLGDFETLETLDLLFPPLFAELL